MTARRLPAALLALSACVAQAQQQPTPVNGDTRLVTFDYDSDQTYLILTRPKSVTHLQLRPQERVKGAFAGDTANFHVVVSADRNNILIRPRYSELATSFTLLTTERNYPIMLRSTPEATGKWYQRVTWNVPELVVQDLALSSQLPEPQLPQPAAPRRATAVTLHEASAPPARSVALDQVDFEYAVQGEADFRPLQVFNDGTRTFLRFSEGMREFPALFALADGEATVLNFSVDGRFVIVQGVLPSMLLKLGPAEVRITRGAARRAAPFVMEAYGG